MFLLLAVSTLSGLGENIQLPPPVAREFRGVWVASVFNIDWPSQRGLSSDKQKEELIAILDLARKLHFNAVILQIRPAGDVLYPSKLEPWSEFLSGEIGKPPEPFYDPLQFAIEEAHKRCLELHAWINPFRAGFVRLKNSESPAHIRNQRPELVVQYGKLYWLEPGRKVVQDHVFAVLHDIVSRYDVDGIHFDDYFYPFWERDESGQVIEFDDEESFMQYIGTGGRKSRDDWRRENVNTLVQRCYVSIKKQKPWVKFGLSPYGIWRPGFPSSVRGGRDMFTEIYCDSRLWFSSGWLDYFAPQLYWKTTTQPNYSDLLTWWSEQNVKNRHLWPGLYDSAIGEWKAQEIVDEILITRKTKQASGNIHYSVKPLLQNRGGIRELLQKQVYTTPALIPASPWLDSSVPAKPNLVVRQEGNSIRYQWSPGDGAVVWQWVIQKRFGNNWSAEIRSNHETSETIPGGGTNATVEIAVTAVNRFGAVSQPAIVTAAKPSSRAPAELE